MGDTLSLLSTQSHITISAVLINIGTTFITSLYILWVYRRISRTSSYDPAFPVSLVLISLITCSVMMTIGQNLALSLGLVGALSIVRFRMAIKDTLDLVFLFFAISVGLAYGASAYLLGSAGALLSGLLVVLLSKRTNWIQPQSGYVLHVQVETESPAAWQVRFEESLKGVTSYFDMTAFSRAMLDAEAPARYQYTYELQLGKASADSLVELVDSEEALVDHQLFSNRSLSA